jgi:hypothetical protein
MPAAATTKQKSPESKEGLAWHWWFTSQEKRQRPTRPINRPLLYGAVSSSFA